MAARRNKKIEAPELDEPADEVAQLRAELAEAEKKRREAEDRLEDVKHEHDQALESLKDRAERAESELTGELRRLPDAPPYRLRLRVLTEKDDSGRFALALRWQGRTFDLHQGNKRIKGRRFTHDPKLESVLVTEDRELAERLLEDPRVEIAPPAA